MIVKGWAKMRDLEEDWSYADLVAAHSLADTLEEAERKARG